MAYSNIRPDLIELVRLNECLYDPKHKHYKNKPVKSMVWENISAKLNIDIQRARDLWRTLRDGYIRNKKAIKSGKNSAYSWSEHLCFLDEVLDSKDSENQDESQQPMYYTEDLYGKGNADSLEQQQEWEVSVASSPRQDYDAQNGMVHSYQQPRQSRKRKNNSMDKVIDYLKSKKPREQDAVDYLFMSYAKTFKGLAARKQAILKVTLAKVFAEAEFGDLSNEAVSDK